MGVGVERARPDATWTDDDRRFPIGWIVFGLVVVVLAAWGVVAAIAHRDPEDVVEDYLSAIAEKDTEGALELVSRSGYGVPYGEDAAFLTPEAISGDWWVVSVHEVRREYSSKALVEAEIAGPGGTAKGDFVVQQTDDEWLLEDPFVEVQFPNSPLSYARVNDKVIPLPDVGYQTGTSYSLFPGLYRFHRSVPGVVSTEDKSPVAAFPPQEGQYSRDDPTIVPGTLTAADLLVDRAQRAVERRIDDCAGFAVATPYGPCPFATDGEIDTVDGRRVTELHSLTWTVERQPVIALEDDRTDELNQGFAVRTAEPGTVTLSGGGVDTEDQPVTFTVTCDVDLSGLRVVVGTDGQAEVSGPGPAAITDSGAGDFNTCRRNA